jgi:hypothetical protein
LLFGIESESLSVDEKISASAYQTPYSMGIYFNVRLIVSLAFNSEMLHKPLPTSKLPLTGLVKANLTNRGKYGIFTNTLLFVALIEL